MSVATVAVPRVARKPAGLRRVPSGVWLAAGLFVAVELAVAGRYGYHRDELYFRVAGHHLAFGYVDQPPLVPWLARLTDVLGGSLYVLRLWPALAGGGVVLLTGVFALEFEAPRRWAVLAAAAAATAGVILGACHLEGTTPFDLLCWLAILLVVTRAVRHGEPNLWLVAGAITGLALYNKETLLYYLLPPLALALIVSPQRRALKHWQPYVALLLALAIALPTFAWQASHHWPALEMGKALHAQHTAASDYVMFIPAQILYPGPLVLPLWLAGLWWLLRSPAAAPFRFLGLTYLFAAAALFATAPGRPYYICGLYGILFAAGARRFAERRTARASALDGSARLPDRVRVGRAWPIVIAISIPPSLCLSLPVLPASIWSGMATKSFNYDLGEQIGWPSFAGQVAAVVDTQPASQRAHEVIFTGNYGEAGALARFGPAAGFPAVYSGHNSYWLWGPPPDTATSAVLVGIRPDDVRQWCPDVHQVASITNPVGVVNDELHAPISVCDRMGRPWSAIWPTLRHYN